MPVGSGYSAIRAAVSRSVDKAFAEPVHFTPLRDGRADATREAMDISAVLRVGGGEEGSLSGSASGDWRSRLAAGRAELHVDRVQYPSLIVRIGDKVRAISRPGRPWFEVKRVDDRGDTRLVLALSEA